MDLRDVRRLAVSLLVLTLAVAAWLLLLWLDDTGRFGFTWTKAALGFIQWRAWMWIGVLLLVTFVATVVLTLFGVSLVPPGFAKGSMRQVQCGHCKAVFFIHDAGHRPISHRCPNCRYLGLYDGMAEAVGDPQAVIGRRDTVQLALKCRNCSHRFEVTDTGIRPLKVSCPNCKAVGKMR